MVNSKIINNVPVCGKCNSDKLSGIRDYKEIVMDDITYTMFMVKCYSCKEDNRYLADVTLEETTGYEINHKISDAKEIQNN
jgi:hypothetical protein